MRRKLAVLFVLCVVVSAAWILVGADMVRAAGAQTVESQTSTEGDFEYEEQRDGRLKIIKYKGSAAELSVPSQINGQSVVGISVGAFKGCNHLVSITIPESVREIEEFNDYEERADIPFRDCENLTEILVEEGNADYSSKDGILYNKAMTKLIYCPRGKRGSITIPRSVTHMGYCSGEYEKPMPLGDCINLTDILVEDGNAWYNSKAGILYSKDMEHILCCPPGKQGNISIPEGVTEIGYDGPGVEVCINAFDNCSGLTGIAIPSSFGSSLYGSVNWSDLSDCANLAEITVDAGNESYSSKDGVIYNKDMTRLLYCPNGKQGILSISSSVYSISFSGSNKLLFGSNKLEGIVVEEGNAQYSSSDGILYNADGTELLCCPAGKQGSVSAKSGVIKINNSAFIGCSRLASITLPESVTSLGGRGSNSKIYYDIFRDCTKLEELVVDERNRVFSTRDGILYNGVILLFCPVGKRGSVTIPNGVKIIEEEAFNGCYGLTNISMPQTLEEIGDGAFYGCSGLTDISMPQSIESIGNVFINCSNLKEINVDKDNTKYVSLDGVLYQKSDEEALEKLICCPAGKEGSVTVAESVWEIGESAFRGCMGLTEITILRSDCSMDGSRVFEGCRDDLVIRCTRGSDAERYAKNHGIQCELFAKKPQTITASDYVKVVGDAKFPIGADADGLLSYESSDEAVVSISVNGIVAIHGEGTAQITIRAPETDIYEAAEKVITITVNPKSGGNENPGREKRPQTITADNYIKTEGDDPFAIGAGTDGDGALSYESSDDSVASVSPDGTVAVKNAGIASITIRAAETENCAAAEKTVTVTVKAKSGTEPDKIGDSFEIAGCVYQITSVVPGEVCLKGFGQESQMKDSSMISVPSWVTFKGVEYDVASIADRACYGMEALCSVRLGENVREIGEQAFAGCVSLERIRVPESVKSIGAGAFAGCSEGFCMICAEGSTAEAYAEENGIRHKSSEDEKEPQTITASDYIKTEGDAPFTIKAVTDGDGELSYVSSNESVAVVSAKGTVVIMGSGTADIIIRAAETENYEAAEKTITITVKAKPMESQKPGNAQKPETGVKPQNPSAKKTRSITAANLKKVYGDSPFPLGAKASGGGTLSYVVKNPAVASVDSNGVVTLKGYGVTEITVRAAANSAYAAAEKTVTLTVVPKKLSVTSVKSTKAGTLIVKWKKDRKASGYIIEYSTDRKFKKKVKTATVRKNKTTSRKLAKLKAGKKYYVRVCAYAEAGGEKIKGAYELAKKAIKVK